MLLVMTDKFAFKMCWKQFLLVPYLLLLSSLSVVISVVRQGFPYQLPLAAPYRSLETFVETFIRKLRAALAQS